MATLVSITNLSPHLLSHPEIPGGVAPGTTDTRYFSDMQIDFYSRNYDLLSNMDAYVEMATVPATGCLKVTTTAALTPATNAVVIDTTAPFTLTLADAATCTDGFTLSILLRSSTGVKATGTFTLAGGNAANGETVTLGTKVYTFEAPALVAATGTLTIAPANIANLETLAIDLKVYTFEEVVDVAAAGVLTFIGNSLDTETLTLDVKVYTLDEVLPPVAATNTLTIAPAQNAGDTETVTLGGQVYTFLTVFVDAPGNVLIGADGNDSLDYLINAINGGPGVGVSYGTGTAPNPDVTAAPGPLMTMDVTAAVPGVGGNAIVCEETMAQGAWTAAGGFLAGGVTDTLGLADGDVLLGATEVDTIANLHAAITLGAGAGTLYAAATTAHPTVTAAIGAGTTLEITALVAGAGGNAIATTDTLTNAAFGAGTLAGGVTDVLTNLDGRVAVGATAADTRDNLVAGIMLTGGPGYAAAMTAHLTVAAAAGAGNTMVATAIVPGVAGNAIATTSAAVEATWGGATLAGGSNGVLTNTNGYVFVGGAAADSRNNLVAAITLGAGAGTVYAAATTLHPTVTAAAGAGTTATITAKTAGLAGNTIATTDTVAFGSFGAATLTGGDAAGDVRVAAAGGDTIHAGAHVDLTDEGDLLRLVVNGTDWEER